MNGILLDLNQTKSELVNMTINVRQTHRASNKGYFARVWSDLRQTEKVGAQLLSSDSVPSGQGLQERQ